MNRRLSEPVTEAEIGKADASKKISRSKRFTKLGFARCGLCMAIQKILQEGDMREMVNYKVLVLIPKVK